ncbi:hypothetical protein NP233_g1820 [Leucocoprinus birnbaumii]|uniref:RRM domain-containing protein n=1 Tax=Leucocoprinus birnbaumii TaxID=56174 RepID=A0AAD5W584_9AGAR|nr:hypothetical protein NP233_g1820 [Leucocoprinus birnbaumii]
MDVPMTDSTGPQIQQPQPSVPAPGFVSGPPIPGQTPVIPGQEPVLPGQPTTGVPTVPSETPAVEESPCETLYIQNLNEKVKPQVMKATLRGLFKSYGEILDVVAHNNLRMRGQAFVSFTSVDHARKAMKDVQRFPLYSKPMQISFAKTRSDAVVKKLDADAYDEHKKRRDDHKKDTRYTNPIKSKFRLKRLAAEVDGGAALPQAKRPAVQMPDEYLPPNKILFLQNLPESVTKDQLTSLFSQYPNLHEVRMIPTKKDIATSTASASSSLTPSLTTTSSSTVSVVSLPGPTHTPSETPVIAGSLVGVIVLIVCVVTLLLLEKRRRRLRAERILRANQRYPGPGNFSSHQLNKSRSLNGYEERSPPQNQDSVSSSGSSPSQTAQPLNHAPEYPPPPPRPSTHESLPAPESRRHRHRPASDDRSTMNPKDHPPTPSLPPSSIHHHKPGQSSSSSNTRSRTPPLSPSQSHTSTPAPLVPRTHPQYPQTNVPQMSLESPAPHGHADGAVGDVALGNNKMASASPSAIFGQANSSDAAGRTANTPGFVGGGSRAGLPSIVVTRDATGENMPGTQGDRVDRASANGAFGQAKPSPTNGVQSGNGNEGGPSGTPDISGGYNHTQGSKPGGEEEDHSNGRQRRLGTQKSQASASGSEYSYPPSGSGSGSTEGADSGSRTGESDKVGLTPEYAGHGRPRTTSDATSGSSPPTSVPPTPVPSTPTQPQNLSRQTTRQPHEERKTIADINNTQIDTSPLSSTRQGQNRSYFGHIQAPIARSRFGDTSLAVEAVEDAPPAYENVWASTREEERSRVQRRQREHRQEESRTQ